MDKRALDRYLTQAPPDNTWWFEQVVEEAIKLDPLWDRSGDFINSAAGETILDYLNRRGYTPAQAAAILIKTYPNKP